MNICYLWVGVPKLFESMSSAAAVKHLDHVLGIFEEQLSYLDFWELKKMVLQYENRKIIIVRLII